MSRSKAVMSLEETEVRHGEPLLQERGKTHGNWHDQALSAQHIKAAWKASGSWQNLPPQQLEALEMISVKISRIVNGDCAAVDHWDDIAGYALLGKSSIAK